MKNIENLQEEVNERMVKAKQAKKTFKTVAIVGVTAFALGQAKGYRKGKNEGLVEGYIAGLKSAVNMYKNAQQD